MALVGCVGRHHGYVHTIHATGWMLGPVCAQMPGLRALLHSADHHCSTVPINADHHCSTVLISADYHCSTALISADHHCSIVPINADQRCFTVAG